MKGTLIQGQCLLLSLMTLRLHLFLASNKNKPFHHSAFCNEPPATHGPPRRRWQFATKKNFFFHAEDGADGFDNLKTRSEVEIRE